MGKEDLWRIYILRNGTKPSVLPKIFQPGHRPSSHEIQSSCVYHGFSSEIPKGQWVNNLGFHPLFSWKLYFFEAFHDGLFCTLHNLFKLSEQFMKQHGTASDKCLFVRPCVFWASKMVTLPWLLNHFHGHADSLLQRQQKTASKLLQELSGVNSWATENTRPYFPWMLVV